MTAPVPRIAVYTGSFDPLTWGHLNVIERGSQLVDRLVVGIGTNPQKNPLFTPEERVEMVREAVDPLGNVEVAAFEGLAVHFVRSRGARLILRGVRSLSDMEAEFTMSLANRKLDPEIETVFLMAGDEYSYISSSLIKQVALLGSSSEVGEFVPPNVAKRLKSKYPVAASSSKSAKP
jgi:pantetheine-phosphate adenylyltransferase